MNRYVVLSIVCLILLLSCNRAPEGSSVNSVTTLTLSEGTNIAMDVSAEAENVVFDLQGTLWTMALIGGKATPITDPKGDARQPSYSPDGKKICYQGYYGNNWQIYTVDVSSHTVNQLTDGLYDHREPDWSGDGGSIVFSSDRAGSYDIWSYSLDDHTMHRITTANGEEYAPAWTWSGDKISYISYDGATYAVHIYALATGVDQVIYESEHKLYATSWRYDDEEITFVEHNWTTARLMSIRVDTKVVSRISDEGQDVFPFRAYHDRDVVVYTADGLIQSYRLDNGVRSTVPFTADISLNRPTYTQKGRNFDDVMSHKIKGIHCPQIAPNGKLITFIALGDVWIKDTEQDAIMRVTDDLGIQLMPNWSPDSKTVYFASDHEGSTAIYAYRVDDQVTTRIGDIATMPSGLCVSPDGTKIAFTMAFGPRNGVVSLMNVNTGESRKIGNNLPFSSSSPSWFPDGKKLAVSILQPYSKLYREGIARVILIDVNTGQISNQKAPEHLSFGARSNDNPVISGDGTQMMYISQGLLWTSQIDAEGQRVGQPTQITKNLSDVPSWTTDAETILYMATDHLEVIDVATGTHKDIEIDIEYQQKISNDITVISGGAIIDVVSGQILENRDIILQGNRIKSIEKHQANRTADRFIDANDRYIVPGLIDMHAHLGSDLGESLGRKWLAWGVTATRDPATYPYDAVNRREAQINANLIHPRIFFTGSPIDGNRVYYNGTYAQQSMDQVKRELTRAKALDYDLIKTYVRLPDSIQSYVVNYAHELGVPVTSHELYPASAYGVDGVEHVMGTSRRGYTPKMSETYHSYDDVISIIAESGMSFTPTIGIYSGYNYLLAQYPALLDDERFVQIESPFAKSSAKAGILSVEEHVEEWTEMFEGQAQMVKDIVDRGGLVIAGTDSPIIPYGFGLFVELLCFQSAGLSPLQVLQTATINAAEVLGTSDHMGSIHEGKLADLLILDNNPLEDIMNLKDINLIFLNGEQIEPSDLLHMKK